MKRVEELLQGFKGNYILPFFWQHGEDEATLRDYMRAINEANIRSVCVECRPHPDFCGPKWWQDMDVILDEAHKRNMKVWILDDDHFPTGHCNGAIAEADISLRPWYVDSVCAECYGPSPANRFNIAAAVKDKVTPKPNPFMPGPKEPKQFFENDEEILSIAAWRIDAGGRLSEYVDLSSQVKDGELVWDVPDGAWRVYVIFLTHNGDGRPDYMNILDHDSVRVLIDEVYEKHYERYSQEFGKTIMGFFSDEPMVGNIAGMYQTARLGDKRKRLTNPWQKDLPAMLEERLGAEWKTLLALLWNDGEDALTVRVRQAYMDAATLLISRNFSGQLASWCEAHGVEYIGHVWEDKTLSCAFGGGLGHYFRAMDGNHMGGVDIVFSSSMKPWGDCSVPDGMGGDFYYHVLGKLAASHASLDAHKKGRAMCESFGATGWDFGVDKMKYLADNLLVSGINRYVPHAFSPKAFPDPDCPPHFYAHGENAQYIHFARLMEYMQRVCHLLDGGKNPAEAAVLYPAENDWVSELDSVTHNMPVDGPARALAEAQIEYQIIPADLLGSGDEAPSGGLNLSEAVLHDGVLEANGVTFKALVVPAGDYASKALADFTKRAKKEGFPVFFVDCLPAAVSGKPSAENICAETEAQSGESMPNGTAGAGRVLAVTEEKAAGEVVSLKELAGALRGAGLGKTRLFPASRAVKCLHYRHENDLYMLVNNDIGRPYSGTITVPNTAKAYIYDAYENVVRPAQQEIRKEESVITLNIAAFNPVILFLGDFSGETVSAVCPEGEARQLKGFLLSSCAAAQYPNFGEAVRLEECVDIAANYPEMMDCYRYETSFDFDGGEKAVLKLDYCSDGVQVWCNDIFVGQRIAPDWVFDLGKAVKPGKNTLRIEVAATPARKVKKLFPEPGMRPMMGMPELTRPEGIIGKVWLISC